MVKFSKEDIKQFKKMDVLAIYLFGSMANGKYIHGRSDFDFGVVLENTEKLKGNTLEIYNELYDIIIEKLPKKYLKKRFKLKAHEFDIVFLQEAPISFQAEVMQEGKVLYASDENKLGRYKDYVLERYCDLHYVYEIAHNYLLERL
ncbi:MAG: nucleotidyltransferase domain-containing protein [Patescibacteria group bacterium]